MAYKRINKEINDHKVQITDVVKPITTGLGAYTTGRTVMKYGSRGVSKAIDTASKTARVNRYTALKQKYPGMATTKDQYLRMRSKGTASTVNRVGNAITVGVTAITTFASLFSLFKGISKHEKMAAKNLVKMVHQGDIDVSDLMAYAKDVDSKSEARIIIKALSELGYDGQASAQFIGETRKKYAPRKEKKKW